MNETQASIAMGAILIDVHEEPKSKSQHRAERSHGTEMVVIINLSALSQSQ